MKLTATKRSVVKKRDNKEIRRAGNVPAVLYSSKGSEPLIMEGTEISAMLRKIKPGRLSTTVFTLVEGNKERRAIVKDIQYQLTSYQVSHLDFQELFEDVPVGVKVPIQCTGAGDCPGIKLGGFLRQVIRHVKVECLPKHIPSEFSVDVKELGIKQSKRLADIAMPTGVTLMAPAQEVVVVIAKR